MAENSFKHYRAHIWQVSQTPLLRFMCSCSWCGLAQNYFTGWNIVPASKPTKSTNFFHVCLWSQAFALACRLLCDQSAVTIESKSHKMKCCMWCGQIVWDNVYISCCLHSETITYNGKGKPIAKCALLNWLLLYFFLTGIILWGSFFWIKLVLFKRNSFFWFLHCTFYALNTTLINYFCCTKNTHKNYLTLRAFDHWHFWLGWNKRFQINSADKNR